MKEARICWKGRDGVVHKTENWYPESNEMEDEILRKNRKYLPYIRHWLEFRYTEDEP